MSSRCTGRMLAASQDCSFTPKQNKTKKLIDFSRQNIHVYIAKNGLSLMFMYITSKAIQSYLHS